MGEAAPGKSTASTATADRNRRGTGVATGAAMRAASG